MSGRFSLKIPDEALENLSSIFKDEQSYLHRSLHQGETIFVICNYVAKHLDILLTPPSTLSSDTHFLTTVESIARESHIRVRRVALEDEWWTYDAGPLIGMTTTGTPCALIPIAGGGYHLVLPTETYPVKVTEELAQTISRVACSFYRPLPDNPLSLKDVCQFALKDLWPDFWRLFTFQASISLIGLFIPIATGLIIETVIPSANFNLLGQAIIGLIVLSFSTAAFKLSQSISFMRLKFKTNVTVQYAVWDRMLRLPLNFFRNFTAGDLAARINGIDAIQQTLNGTILSGLLGGFFSLFTLMLIFLYDLVIGFVILGLAAIGAMIYLSIIYYQLKYQRQLLNLQGKNSNLVFQFINGISKLRAHVRESAAFLQWSQLYSKIVKTFKQFQIIANRLSIFLSLYTGIFMTIFFILIIYRLDTIAFSSFIALSAATSQFRIAFMDMLGTVEQLLNIIPLYERVRPILTSTPEIHRKGMHPGILEGNITVQQVCFCYKHGDPFVFSDLNLIFEEGKFIALIGPSGAGKSTLFRLLLGFETPQEGKILFDGKNLTNLNIKAVRQQLGVVLQSSTLLPCSILENIVGSNPNLTIEDAWEATHFAGIDEYIRTLPMGMQTLISEEGRTFSMGQRQRLMIARALAPRPKILLLDEATSALDNATQAVVQQNLEKLNVTRIVAAHRLSTIINADLIYVFNNKGRIVQKGTYQELLKQKGLFSEIIKKQLVN